MLLLVLSSFLFEPHAISTPLEIQTENKDFQKNYGSAKHVVIRKKDSDKKIFRKLQFDRQSEW